MDDQVEWAPLKSFGSAVEADMARAILEGAGIPVMVHGEQTGLFGPGFSGWTPGGVNLAVPSSEVERASELVEGLEGES